MNTEAYQTFLVTVLEAQRPVIGLEWLQTQLANLTSARALYLAFSLAPRFVGKAQLRVTAAQLAQAHQLRPGFDPSAWTADQAARTLLLLCVPHASPAEYTALLDQLVATAELGEVAALYTSLPLLPYSEAHVVRAAEGISTTMTNVFDAIALDNPYSHDYLSQDAWNQLVLKAVFNARPLYRIYGLDERRNEALARMLVAYAHEQRAAGRSITPELWRVVGPFLLSTDMVDINQLLLSVNMQQQQAASLALAESKLPAAPAYAQLNLPSVDVHNRQQRMAAWQRIGERAHGVTRPAVCLLSPQACFGTRQATARPASAPPLRTPNLLS
jgi:hypothetical protein